MNRVMEADSFEATGNLAVEEALFDAHDGDAWLFLWRNDHVVVIGRNQNAWKECRVSLLESEGGQLVRRKTGGGAVYHDLGNLNFSFVVSRQAYDVTRQNAVIIRALDCLGLDAVQTGRNDMVLANTGEKFSGSAFRIGERSCLHHGTILIAADMERLSRYLAPSPIKLQAKGIDSVRARVTNLRNHLPVVTVEDVMEALRAAFIREYGAAREMGRSELEGAHIAELQAGYASWEWRFGNAPPFDAALQNRFEWGGIELMLSLEHGRITGVKLYTDSLEAMLADDVQRALMGIPYAAKAMRAGLCTLPSGQARELGEWLGQLAL